MGTWGAGLSDSDSALDLVGDHANTEEQAICKLIRCRPRWKTAEQLAGRIGLLLMLSPGLRLRSPSNVVSL